MANGPLRDTEGRHAMQSPAGARTARGWPARARESEMTERGALYRIARNAASILIRSAGGDLLASYAIALAAVSLGASGFGILSSAQAFMDPFQTLCGFGLGVVTVTIAARRG